MSGMLGLAGAEVSHRAARGFHTLMPGLYTHRTGEREHDAVYLYNQDVRMMYQFADVIFRPVGSRPTRCGGGE